MHRYSPHLCDIHKKQAEVCRLLGNTELALSHCQTALQLSSPKGDFEIFYKLATIYYDMEKLQSCLEYLEKSKQCLKGGGKEEGKKKETFMREEEKVILEMEGNTYQKLGKYDDALKVTIFSCFIYSFFPCACDSSEDLSFFFVFSVPWACCFVHR